MSIVFAGNTKGEERETNGNVTRNKSRKVVQENRLLRKERRKQNKEREKTCLNTYLL